MTNHADILRAGPHGLPGGSGLLRPSLKFLLVAGVPLGFNALVTIRGRTSGLPRTTPIAVIDASGRRWVWAPWGEVHWVRNLRAAGRATVTVRGSSEEVRATELDASQRVEFFRDVLGRLARGIPLGYWFIRVVDQVDLNRPEEAAEGRRVFELHPLDDHDGHPQRAGGTLEAASLPCVLQQTPCSPGLLSVGAAERLRQFPRCSRCRTLEQPATTRRTLL